MVYGRLEEIVGRAEVVKSLAGRDSMVAPTVPAAMPWATTHRQPPPPPPPPPPEALVPQQFETQGAAEAGVDDAEKERMRRGLQSAIMTEKPNIKWDDVAGL